MSTIERNMVNKMTTSRLELRFKRAQEPLVIETRSSNKKQANANCAVLAVRELYKRGFIEKFGTRTENYDDEQVLSLDRNWPGSSDLKLSRTVALMEGRA